MPDLVRCIEGRVKEEMPEEDQLAADNAFPEALIERADRQRWAPRMQQTKTRVDHIAHLSRVLARLGCQVNGRRGNQLDKEGSKGEPQNVRSESEYHDSDHLFSLKERAVETRRQAGAASGLQVSRSGRWSVRVRHPR